MVVWSIFPKGVQVSEVPFSLSGWRPPDVVVPALALAVCYFLVMGVGWCKLGVREEGVV